jgi:hypothetical protein
MGKQVKKVCKHEPGEKWTDGCCSPNPSVENRSVKSNEQVIESAPEQSSTAQTEAQKHSANATTFLGVCPISVL